MIILGIDPGEKKSGIVWWDTKNQNVIRAEHADNEDVLRCISEGGFDRVAIEQIRSYRLVAGNDTIDTIWWSGRFYEAAMSERGYIAGVKMIPRRTKDGIVHHLCGVDSAGDKGVRAALVDRYGEPGPKKSPGKLYGIAGHLWAALACAVVASEKYGWV